MKAFAVVAAWEDIEVGSWTTLTNKVEFYLSESSARTRVAELTAKEEKKWLRPQSPYTPYMRWHVEEIDIKEGGGG